MKALSSLAYGFAAYALFLVTILYTVGFVGNFSVPKSIDSGTAGPVARAVAVDLLLLAGFAVQHSVMARPWFKQRWKRIFPAAVERSTFVAASSLVLLLTFWQWQPIPANVWTVSNSVIAGALQGLCWTGWLVVFASSFLIDHFELFGVTQVIAALRGSEASPPVFRTPLFYRFVRHPLYLGFLIAFWSTPIMTAGHLLFSLAMTGYIFIGIHHEERDLVRVFGDRYRRYQARVGMLLPRGVARDEDGARERAPSSVA